MFVTKRNGNKEPIKFDNITARIEKLVKPEEVEYIDSTSIAQKVVATIYPDITTNELDTQSAEICINL